MCAAASPASASVACAHRGERTLARSPQLALIMPARRSGLAGSERIVCRRDSGTRRTLVRLAAGCSHCATSVSRVALHGRFAFAVLSLRTFNDQQAELVTLDTDTWRTHLAALDLGDQDDVLRTDVTDLVALPRGRAVLRTRNDFAAGIVLAGPATATYLDEGRVTAIGRPRVSATRVIWRHGGALRSSSVLPADRCPRAPAPRFGLEPGPAGGRILATAEAVTSGNWACVRATGAVERLDGSVVRLLGPLAVIQRAADVRVVDLRSGATITGPAVSDASARSSATVGPSGTLVLRRPGGCGQDAEIVAVAAGGPERRIACGDLRDLRYVDGLVRYRDQATGAVVRALVP